MRAFGSRDTSPHVQTYARTYVHATTTYMLHVRPEKRLIRDDSEGRKVSVQTEQPKSTAVFLVRDTVPPNQQKRVV